MGGCAVGEELQNLAEAGVVLRGEVRQQGGTLGPEGVRQGGGEQFEILPEKGVPHCGPCRGPVGRRDAPGFVEAGQKGGGFRYAEGLDIAGLAEGGQLFGGECPGEPHPHGP